MLFNSFEFLLFLPIVFAIYWFVFKPLKWQNLWIVVASYIFYGWWNWHFLILIALTTVFSFVSGILIDRYREKLSIAKVINTINICLNLGILCIFKYYNFFVASFAGLFGLDETSLTLNIILPVGISFYTFQALSYSIDVYRQKIDATKNLVEFAAYISFFPQLVAGPIERATNLLPQFQKPRHFDYTQAADGLRQILLGLFKKMIVADHCAEFVNYVFDQYQSAHLGGLIMFLGAVAFTFQIYGDFSGYSDIAIGTAKLFGIKLMRNFNVPYFSRDIAEFWRRWHISLTSWFKDYLYIPLGGSREGLSKTIRNTFIIFLVSGLWHGANWTFIVWGAYHALLFVPLLLMNQNRKYIDVVASQRNWPTWKEFGQMLWTFLWVVIGWIIFRAESISQAFDYIVTMFTRMGQYSPIGLHIYNFYYIALLLLLEWFSRKEEHAFAYVPVPWRWARLCLYAAVFILIIVWRGNQAVFIYFQF